MDGVLFGCLAASDSRSDAGELLQLEEEIAGFFMSQMESAYPIGHGLSGEQLELIYEGMRNIEQDFWRFEHENPKVYRKLVNLAREVKGAGHDHYSIDALFHRLRWHYSIEVKSAEPFKLNDHFTSFYARLIMQREPDLSDFFEIRKQRSKGSR